MAAKKTVRRKERRRLSRADAALSMRVEGGSTDGGLVPIVTESRNISGSGVYCYSPHYLAPLSKVALTIVLPAVSGRTPSQRLLKCEGLVVRCLAGEGARKDRAYQLACSFVGLEPVTRDRLEEYVVWRNIQSLRKATAPAARRRAPARRPATATARKATTRRSSAATGAGAAARATPRKRRTVH
jgi:c-di-GMP-binding flagellar brake protein YcgR